MSLSERDQRALDSIEDRLAGSNPELASMLATFTRLAADEALPARERIRAAGSNRRERLRWQVLPTLIWLVISVAMISAALTLSSGGKGGSPPCPEWAATCVMQTHGASP